MCIRISGGKWHMQQELQSFSGWVWIQRYLTADLLQKSQFENRMLSPMLFKAISWKRVSQVDYEWDMPLHYCSWIRVIGYVFYKQKLVTGMRTDSEFDVVITWQCCCCYCAWSEWVLQSALACNWQRLPAEQSVLLFLQLCSHLGVGFDNNNKWEDVS